MPFYYVQLNKLHPLWKFLPTMMIWNAGDITAAAAAAAAVKAIGDTMDMDMDMDTSMAHALAPHPVRQVKAMNFQL